MSADTANVLVDFVVKFGKETLSLTLPLTATLLDVKSELAARTQVQPDKQRLMLNAPVDKDKRRDTPDSCTLEDLFPPTYTAKIRTHAASATVPQHIKVTAMLIGSSHVGPMVDSKATAEISRLVSTTVEHDGQWYRCCYGKGYLRQSAYVCRTCVAEGRADPAHGLCLACAEMCHGNHEVEEWGVRYCMRCDCCTKKCWQTPPEGYTRMPRLSDAIARDEVDVATAGAAAATVAVMSSSDVSARFDKGRKRSRSSSPLTPKRTTTGSGGSPVSGVRVAAVANAPSPFSLQDLPANETQAVTSPVTGTLPAPRGGPRPETHHGSSNEALASTSKRLSTGSDEEQRANAVHDPTRTVDAGGSKEVVVPAASYKPLPETDRCMFLLDSRTGKPPVSAVIPAGSKNRYPRDPLHWCYCKDDHPSDSGDCGGIVCILCTTCFWSDHVPRLYSDPYRRVPCYGDVVQGDTLAFKCTDCNTYVCPPCRLRCHRHHNVEPNFICPSSEDGTDNGAPPGVNFSCGCRGLCSIAETVPQEEVEDLSTYMPMPPEVATALMDNDVFTGFVCGHCMQENPWLMTDSPTKCYHGALPAKVPADSPATKPIVACKERGEPKTDKVFPWHGMIVPVTSFTQDATCGCGPCRAAFEAFAPRATEDATEMIVQLHDECDNCGASLKDKTAFMCQTCEMSMDKAFMVCRSCNDLRLRRIRERTQSSSTTDSLNQGQSAGTTATASATAEGNEEDPQQEKPPAYHHSLDHEFIEDTNENMYALAGMQMMQSMDAESLAFLQNNWESMKDQIQVTSSLVETFGQIPVTFTNDELETMAEENRRASTGTQQQQPQQQPGDTKPDTDDDGDRHAKVEKKE